MTTVFFKRFRSTSNQEAPYAVFSPRDIRWNDFNRNYHADLEIRLPDPTKIFNCQALVLPIKEKSPEHFQAYARFDSWLNERLNSSSTDFFLAPAKIENTEELPDFVTLLQGESIYRNLASFFPSRQQRLEFFNEINDLAFLSSNKILPPEFIKAIFGSEDFNLGFMRRGSAFRALHRGPRHITGNYSQNLTDARAEFIFQSPLHGFTGTAHSLDVKFKENNLIEDRVHCLIGKNGCGKTRLLHELILELANRAEPSALTSPFFDNSTSSARSKIEYSGPDFRRVLCFSFDYESRFPSGTRTDSALEYVYTNLHFQKTSSAENASTSTGNLTRLFVDIFRNSDPIGGEDTSFSKTRWQLLIEALSPHIDVSALHIPLGSVNNRSWVEAKKLRYIGEQASLEKLATVDFDTDVAFLDENGKEFPLSSGHRVFLKFAISILSFIDLGTLVIIDEPETHLHPNLVCDFMNLLYTVLQATKSVALVATHSVYVIREVPTHCAHVYRIDESKTPSESNVYLRTLGANIENISQAVFSDTNAKKFHMKIAKSLAREQKTIDELIEKYSDIASPELLSQVARIMRNPASQTSEEDSE